MLLGSSNQVVGPSVVVFDLNTDQLIHRYYLKVSDMKEDTFFANIVSTLALVTKILFLSLESGRHDCVKTKNIIVTANLPNLNGIEYFCRTPNCLWSRPINKCV